MRISVLTVCNVAAVAAASAHRPNVVWVMADDLGWGEPGLYPANSPHGRIATPHLDQFGKEGVVFTHAYAGYTVCAPSRTTFFTGRHGGKFVENGWNGQSLAPNQNVTTIAHLFQKAGYRTGAFGKVAPLTSPLEQGFDDFIGQIDQALCHNMYPRAIDTGFKQVNYPLIGNQQEKSRELCMKHPEQYNYTIDVFHDSAMSWLEKVAKGEKPFFLYLSFTIPHAGGWGEAPDTPEQGNPVPTDLQYAHEPWPDVEKDHAAVITYLDGKVGDLMAHLKALGVDHDTLVLFASDNGAHLEGGHNVSFFDSTGGLPGHKRSMFEGGVRSPTMARWPSTIKPNRTSAFAWAFWDAFPTFAEIVGTEMPAETDGISILPTLRGDEQAPHEYLYFTWSGTGGGGPGLEKTAHPEQQPPGYTVLKDKWKGMVPHCANAKTLAPSLNDEMMLFDLSADPFETTDLAAKNPDVVSRLKKFVISKNLTCMCYQCHYGETYDLIVV